MKRSARVIVDVLFRLQRTKLGVTERSSRDKANSDLKSTQAVESQDWHAVFMYMLG